MNKILKNIITLVVFLATASSAYSQYAQLSSVRIQQIATMLSANPSGIGTPCTDRAAWSSHAGQFKAEVARAEDLLRTPFPAWSDDAYLDYSRTGSRQWGERMLHDRQDQLVPLVLAECAEGRGRFVARIAMVLDGLTAQKSWTLPAHDVKLESYKGTHYFVELNSADLAQTIAETLYLMGVWLPQKTRSRSMEALQQRIFDPMRASYVSDKGQSWLHVESNWNAVCLKGVTGAALTVLPNREDRALFVAAAEHYINNYRKGFSDDGYAAEGIGYWNYGFSHYAELREDLWQATKGRLDFFSDPRMRKVALFGAQFPMLPDNAADFGDAHFMTKPDPNLMAYINRIFGMGLPDDRVQMLGSHTPKTYSSLALAIEEVFPNHASELTSGEGTTEPSTALVGVRAYYPDAGVLVSRPEAGGHLAVTIKSGGNTSHSHNDIGSFSIGLGLTQPVGDPGGPSYYTAQTFSENRLQSRLINSLGHPVPMIDGRLQLDATKVHAPVVKTEFSPKQDSIMIDMTNAYDSRQLRRLERTMLYRRAGTGAVEIEDKFDLTGPVDIEESLPTHGTWTQLDAKTLLFTTDIERLRVAISAPAIFTVKQEKIDEYGNPFTRVGIRLRMKKSGSVKMLFTPEN